MPGSASIDTLATVPLGEALGRCSTDVRTRARNFWFGLRLLPREHFHSLCTVYSWMRLADDLADGEEGGDRADRREALEGFRRRTLALFDGDAPEVVLPAESHIMPAMRRLLDRHELDPRDFDRMIDGQLSDLDARVVETRAQLLEYCDQVASTVGRICVRIWGGTSEPCLELATERGKALQLTNILRDVREDHGRQRQYLPEEELRTAGLDREVLAAWGRPGPCRAFVLDQVARAEAHYQRARGLESMIEPACRPTSLAMTRIYHALLAKIGSRPELISGDQRIRLSSFRKFSIAVRARREARKAGGGRLAGSIR